MRGAFGPEVEAFRAEVLDFIAAEDWGHNFFHASASPGDDLRCVYEALGDRGWLSLTWPTEHGGSGLTAAHEFVLWDEMSYARIARPPMGAGLVAKALIAHGSEQQQSELLPGLRSGRVHFGLGYSEPEAGSDLGGVRTRARRVDDHYVVDGAKCWTSNAHWVDYLWTLCRTGESGSGSGGVSVLMIPTDAPGVTVSPLPTLDGSQLNEVLFDGVRVPAFGMVGEENGGWAIVSSALAVERHIQFPSGRCRRDFDDLLAWAHERADLGDKRLQGLLVDVAVELENVEDLAIDLVRDVVDGEPSAVVAAYHKLAGTALCQSIAQVAMDLGAEDVARPGSPVEFMWRQSILETIGGGTTEVMKNLIAKRDLGLASRR